MRKRVRSVKKSVDNTPPASFGLPHLSRNLKKAQMLEDQYRVIESRNRTLLQRMSKIADNPSLTTDNHNDYQKHLRSLNFRRRKANREKLLIGNSHMLQTLKSTKPYYKAEQWESDYSRSEKIMRHMMEYDLKPSPPPKRVPKPSLLPDEDAPRTGPGFLKGKSKPAKSPKKLKSLALARKQNNASKAKKGRGSKKSKKGQSKKGQQKISVDDEVVEIFRFPALPLRGVERGIPDTTWNICMFDTRASMDEGAGNTSFLIIRGNRVSDDTVATLALDDAIIDHLLSQDTDGMLTELFERIRSGVRAYRALGLLRGHTQSATVLATALLDRLRVTRDFQFTVSLEVDVDKLEQTAEVNRGVEILEAEEQAEAARQIQAVIRGRQTRKQQEAASSKGDTVRDGAAQPSSGSAEAGGSPDGGVVSLVGYYERKEAGVPSPAWLYRGPAAERARKQQSETVDSQPQQTAAAAAVDTGAGDSNGDAEAATAEERQAETQPGVNTEAKISAEDVSTGDATNSAEKAGDGVNGESKSE